MLSIRLIATVSAMAAFAALSLTASAQDFDPEVMAKMAPGEMHELLAKMEGEWDVAVQFRFGDGPMQENTAECSAEMRLAGTFLFKEYKSELMGAPFLVHQHLGYDGLREHFWEFTLDTMSTSYQMSTGKISEDKKTITLANEGPDPFSDGTLKTRIVYRLVSDDEYVVEWWEDRGEGEQMSVRLAHTRKKKG